VNQADDATRAAGLIGSTLAERYRLDALISAARTSALFRAMDLREGAVALKVLYPDFLSVDESHLFVRDSSTLLMVRHPHLVEALGVGTDQARGLTYLARTLVVARTVHDVQAELGVLEPTVAVRMALHAAHGVGAAHRVGVLHRGLKPENLFLDLKREDELAVRVADFGCARLARDQPDSGSTGPRVPPCAPDYLAPEQLRDGMMVDERTDVWGIGAVLYELLSGSPPFGHLEKDADVVLAITQDDVPHVQDRAPWVTPELSLVLHRALSRDPDRRYATLEELAQALVPLAHGEDRIGEATVTTVPSTLRTRVADRADIVSEPPPASLPQKNPAPTDELGLVGQQLDNKYRVLRMIGRGGMGSVYEVGDPDGKRFAAKLISRGLAGENHPALVRFAREARAASAISSPNVVATLDAGTDEKIGLPYIIMELLHGTDLSSVLKREGALEPPIAVRLALQAARGIAAAHARSVVHRDIKPANLFLQVAENTGEVTVKVCDFGVAKRTRIDGRTGRTSGLSLTRTGGMVGSPMYMAPEQARNAKSVDERADVWSLAVVTWEALAGARLWGQQTSLAELIVAICTDPLRRLEEAAPWIPLDLARVVHKALERDVTQRTPSMHAFIAGLELFAGGSDRVTADQLVGLTPEHRAVLAQRTKSISPSRSAVTAPGTRVHVPRHPTPMMASVGKWQSPAPPKESSLWLWAAACAFLIAASVGAWLFLR
jgi:serine/threonine protein kinase